MKATHIYINLQGVPCAPTKELPKSYEVPGQVGIAQFQWGTVAFMKECKESAIPIREEDWMIFYTSHEVKRDTFYPVEPYEFEVEQGPGFAPMTTTLTARIIRSSEPKADPKEKELYSIKPLEWVEVSETRLECSISDYEYAVAKVFLNFNTRWRAFFYFEGNLKGSLSEKTFDFADEAKQACTDHFNSKLKLCLNREL